MIKTSFIVLRKTPYQECGLVVAGISPECGRVDLIVKGARAIGRKKFPVYELFRELAIQFNEAKSGNLVTPKSSEPLESFDEIAAKPEAYLEACELAAFHLKNSRCMLGCPATYEALKTSLRTLISGELAPKPAAALSKLVCLQESGFLPDDMGEGLEGESQARLLAEILAGAAGDAPLPNLSPSYWLKLAGWTSSLCAFHGLN